MKAVLQLLFLVFYVGSSYTITQGRTLRIVEEFQHSSSRGEGNRIEEACKQLVDGFPKDRQAKPKANSDFYFSHNEPVYRQPHACFGFLTPNTVGFRSIFSFENVLSRAPPLQL